MTRPQPEPILQTETVSLPDRSPHRIALTRSISPAMASCELTHLNREPIDLARAASQHATYEETLRSFGCDVQRLASSSAWPDAVFIEDTAVVLDEVAVITRPGAPSRRPETEGVSRALSFHRNLQRIEPPGTLDGGDVLRVGRQLFVGHSSRTNPAGLDQLARISEPYGYTVHPVVLRGCLHLKTAVTALDERTLLIQSPWIEDQPFADFDRVEVDPREPFAANCLRVGNQLLYPDHFPRTHERLRAAGYAPHLIGAEELAKAEGGLTCCSLLFEKREGDYSGAGPKERS